MDLNKHENKCYLNSFFLTHELTHEHYSVDDACFKFIFPNFIIAHFHLRINKFPLTLSLIPIFFYNKDNDFSCAYIDKS